MTPFRRIGIVTGGGRARRFETAVRDLVARDGREISIVAFAGPERPAWVRRADEIRPMPEDDDPAAIVEALRAANVDAVWFGAPRSAPDPATGEALRLAGIALIGPQPEALLRMAPGRASRGRDQPPAQRTAGHRVEVTVLADARGSVYVMPGRLVSEASDGDWEVAEAGRPMQAHAAGAVERARGRAGRRAADAGLRAGMATFSFAPARGGSLRLASVTGGPGAGDPATQAASGIDLHRAEIELAEEAPLPPEMGASAGDGGESASTVVALCARIRALDAGSGPAPVLEVFRPGGGAGVTVDAMAEEGDVLPPTDGDIAWMTASGRDLREAAARLTRAVAESVVIVRGEATDQSRLVEIIASMAGARSPLSIDGGGADTRGYAAIALAVAAVDAYDEDTAADRARFLASAARGRPQAVPPGPRAVELLHQDRRYVPIVGKLAPNRYRVTMDARSVEVEVDRAHESIAGVTMTGGRHATVCVRGEADRSVWIGGEVHRFARDDGGLIRSPGPAVVVATSVAPGDDVGRGDPVVVLESMKTELSVVTTLTGKVRRVLVSENTQVDTDTPLVQIAAATPADGADGGPNGSDGAARSGRASAPGTASRAAPLHLPELRAAAVEDGSGQGTANGLAPIADRLRRLLLGYDVDVREAAALAAEWRTASRAVAADDVLLLSLEEDLLDSVAAIWSFGRLPDPAPVQAGVISPREDLLVYLRSLDATDPVLPHAFLTDLRIALAQYGVSDLRPGADLEEAAFRLWIAQSRGAELTPVVMSILDRRLEAMETLAQTVTDRFRRVVDRLIEATRRRNPAVADLAREVRFRYVEQPVMDAARDRVYERMNRHLRTLERASAGSAARAEAIEALVQCAQPLKGLLIERAIQAAPRARRALLEALTRRYYRIRPVTGLCSFDRDGRSIVTTTYEHDGGTIRLVTSVARASDLAGTLRTLAGVIAEAEEDREVVLDVYLWDGDADGEQGAAPDGGARSAALAGLLDAAAFPRPLRRVVIASAGRGRRLGIASTQHFTFRHSPDGYREEALSRGFHPMMGKRLGIGRLANFEVERLASAEDVYLFRAVARTNPKDERLIALAEVRDLTPIRDPTGRVVHLPALERILIEALEAMRLHLSHQPAGKRMAWNRIMLRVWPPFGLSEDEVWNIVHELAPLAAGLGLEAVVLRVAVPDEASAPRNIDLVISNPVGDGMTLAQADPDDEPLEPLTPYMQRVVQSRQRGLTYPFEIVRLMTPPQGAHSDLPPGSFVEYDLDDEGRLRPVDRPYGENAANIVVGTIRNAIAGYPEGAERVVLLGDPSRALGSLAEAECRRIVAALDLAEDKGVPLEWFAVSAGAKIAMDSGTENMDWIGRVLRRLIEFTQAGGEVNVVVCGINVGAQPYWNAEATMLMHTRGVLIMTPDSAMVLTGKQALDYSGGVSAEDNFGIGGYDRVMGPNGQAQYWSPDLHDACRTLLRHYEHTYVVPGERFPRRIDTSDPFERDVRSSSHRASQDTVFRSVGEVFDERTNAGRKHAFDVRSVMRAVCDSDQTPLERWPGMRDGEIAVVWDAHIGGFPACLLGIESKPVPRRGPAPADGPERWTPGTLFPISSKKIARAINAASGNRPLVVLANLSGFDGSPESLRNLQLEYGAEIGRAVVNFRGPIVFCVISRYHGGAFVVFSATLNDRMEIAAVEGSFASVIGGAPAAAVVFAREVDALTDADPRIVDRVEALNAGADPDRPRLRRELEAARAAVRNEKLGEVAARFDGIHTIYRARAMGSVHAIVPPERLRPYIIDAIERGVRREMDGLEPASAAAVEGHRS